MGRSTEYKAPGPPGGCPAQAPAGSISGAVHAVLDWAITFRSPQPELLEAIDGFLGTGAATAPGTPLLFDVCERNDGQVLLTTEDGLLFPHREACLENLTAILNEYAAWSDKSLALHAAAVRSPDREVVLLPGHSGAGKSTLAAALVLAGWDYLGDEAIGVRGENCTAVGYPKRLALDLASRRLLGLNQHPSIELDPAEVRPGVTRLGGEISPVGRVILPAYDDSTEVTMEALGASDAVLALLASTLNLAHAGQPAFDILCELATNRAIYRVKHNDFNRAVEAIATTSYMEAVPFIS